MSGNRRDGWGGVGGGNKRTADLAGQCMRRTTKTIMAGAHVATQCKTGLDLVRGRFKSDCSALLEPMNDVSPRDEEASTRWTAAFFSSLVLKEPYVKPSYIKPYRTVVRGKKKGAAVKNNSKCSFL